MDQITSRSCDYQQDRERLLELLLIYRAATDIRLYPTIWRIQLLLTSRVWQPEKDTQIWKNKAGQIIGFVMLWRRKPDSDYIIFDGFIHPQYLNDKLPLLMFEWGNQRAKTIGMELRASVTVFANGFSDANFIDQIQQKFGYEPITQSPDQFNVYFSKELGKKISTYNMPEGCEIEYLNTSNLEKYRSLHSFAQVNRQHQKEQLISDEYCHLVVVNKNDDFLAYCECSVCHAEWEITQKRIGWIDYIETKPEFQRKGYGQMALLAGLSKLAEWGADTAMLVTINTNLPAVGLYKKAGFKDENIVEPPRYKKQYKWHTAGDEP